MGEILEFDSARTPFCRAALRAVDLLAPAQWRLESRGVNPRFSDTHLEAVPHLVATRRTGEICVVRFLRGSTPIDVSDHYAEKAVLDATIVRSAFERQGRIVTKVMVWLVFDDGGRIEFRATDSFARSLVERAQASARTLNAIGSARI